MNLTAADCAEGLFTGVRGIRILRTSRLRSLPKFGVSKKGRDTAATVFTMCTWRMVAIMAFYEVQQSLLGFVGPL
jgi:hypothetical protein